MVSWRAVGGDSILLSASLDGGGTWRDLVSRPAVDGFYILDAAKLPEETPVLLRLRLRDIDGRPLAEAKAPGAFMVDRRPPTARATGPSSSEASRVEVSVEASDGKGSGVASVSLWACEEGKPWFLAVEAAEPGKPVAWTASHHGRWGLVATARDRAGNAGPSPSLKAEPQLRILVRSPEPWISRFALETSDLIVPGGHAIPLAWAVEGEALGEGPVTIEVRGPGGSWVSLGKGLPAKGSLAWKLPERGATPPELRLRASAGGRESVRELLPTILVDVEAPRVLVKGPARWEKPGEVPLEVQASDELSGLAGFSLWRWDAGGWAEIRRVQAGQPLTYNGPDGRHALWVVAADALGNVSAKPEAGAKPKSPPPGGPQHPRRQPSARAVPAPAGKPRSAPPRWAGCPSKAPSWPPRLGRRKGPPSWRQDFRPRRSRPPSRRSLREGSPPRAAP